MDAVHDFTEDPILSLDYEHQDVDQHCICSLQVKHLSSPCGASNAQLLLQLELHMLLGLVVHQLTASIPATYLKAEDVRAVAYQLNCSPLLKFFIKTNLHIL
jgi:hypothetical protein